MKQIFNVLCQNSPWGSFMEFNAQNNDPGTKEHIYIFSAKYNSNIRDKSCICH